MANLLDVFAEFFRAFGYTPTLNTELEGTTGRRHGVALLLEKDSRRLAVATWTHRGSLGPSFLREFIDATKDTGCDGGLLVSLGAVPEALSIEASKASILVWDSRRTAQELGNAVLRETSPDVWEQTDPWQAPRPSKILDQVQQTALAVEPAPVLVETPPAPPANDPVAEPQVAAAITPTLATHAEAPADTLQVPLAFQMFDAPLEGAPAPPPPTVAATTVIVEAPPTRPGRSVLRLHVPKALATSLAKPKLRTVDRLFLRLVPYHVFDYEASLLVEGSLHSEKRTGRMAVEASTKRVKDWTHPLDTADFAPDADVDEKPLRVAEADARKILMAELKTLVTRDVVMEEDDSEWSVVVKKKVELNEEELRLIPLGVHWMPIWRATGRDGAVEIDATTGQFVFEEVSAPKSDAVLI